MMQVKQVNVGIDDALAYCARASLRCKRHAAHLHWPESEITGGAAAARILRWT